MNDKARELIHKMRGSLSVVGTFVQNFEPRDEDEREHLEVVKKSVVKLVSAVEELSENLKTDC